MVAEAREKTFEVTFNSLILDPLVSYSVSLLYTLGNFINFLGSLSS